MNSSVFQPIFGTDRYGADAYLQQHHIVDFYWDAIKTIVQDQPLNPYLILVQHFQRHEIYKSLALHISDAEIVARLRSPIVRSTEQGCNLFHHQDGQDPALYWTLTDLLIPYTDPGYIRQIHADLDDILQVTQSDDNDIQLVAIPSIALESVLSRLLMGGTRQIEIGRDVFVTGTRFESALTSFTKFILQDLITLQNRTQHEFQHIVLDNSNIWDLTQIYANRNAFFKDLKRSTIDKFPIRADCILGRTELRLGQIRYICHYRPNATSPYQTFDRITSRSAFLNIFLSHDQSLLYGACLGKFIDPVKFRQQFLDEIDRLQTLRARFRTGRYHAVLAQAILITLLGSGTASAPPDLLAFYSRLNSSLPGSIQIACGLLQPCCCGGDRTGPESTASSSEGGEHRARVRAEQYRRVSEYIGQMIQIPLNSDLVVLAPTIRDLLQGGPGNGAAIVTALEAVQDTIAIQALRRQVGVARLLRNMLDRREGSTTSLPPPSKSATVETLLDLVDLTSDGDRLRDAKGALLQPDLSLVRYLIDFQLDLAYRDAMLALTSDCLTQYPYTKLVGLFALESMRWTVSSSGQGCRPPPSPSSLIPHTDLQEIFALADIDSDVVVLGPAPALHWCQATELSEIVALLGRSGSLPDYGTIVLHGPVCRLGTLFTRVNMIEIHVTQEREADRFETAVLEFSLSLIQYMQQLQRCIWCILEICIGTQSWSIAQLQQGPEIIQAAIRAAVNVRDPIHIQAVLDQDHRLHIQFDLLYVNRSTRRLITTSSLLPAHILYECVALDAVSVTNFYRTRTLQRDKALDELRTDLHAPTPNQIISSLATIAVLEHDRDLDRELRQYRGSTTERLQACVQELDAIRAGLRVAALRQRYMAALNPWRDRVRDIVTAPSMMYALAVRKRVLTAVDEFADNETVAAGLADDLNMLSTLLFNMFVAGHGRVRSRMAATAV